MKLLLALKITTVDGKLVLISFRNGQLGYAAANLSVQVCNIRRCHLRCKIIDVFGRGLNASLLPLTGRELPELVLQLDRVGWEVNAFDFWGG